MISIKNTSFTFFLLLMISSVAINAQVGVNTTTPLETLDINGTAAIRDLDSNSTNTTVLTGADASGVLGNITVGENLELNNGVLRGTGGATRYLPAIISGDFYQNTTHNLDLDLNGANSDRTLFILRGTAGTPGVATITGIAGGTDGRLIVIKADVLNFNMFIVNESTDSLPENRFQFNQNPNQSENVNGYGSFTFIYVASEQRWILLNREIL